MGESNEAPQPSKIFKRLQPFTCEWLTRPDVALSEYSDTITSNFPVLEEHGKKVLRKSFADKLKSHFEPIWEMQALNKKNTNATPTATYVKEVLRSMLDDDELDAKMEQIFYLSGAMFAMSTNYLIATSLVRHHKEFGKLVSGRNRAAASFRQLGSVQGMKNYILHRFKDDGTASQNLSGKSEKSVTNSFAESPSESDFHSDKEDRSPSSNSRKTGRTAKRRGKEKATTSRQRVTICPPEDEDTSPDDEEIIKSSNKKRTPIHQLVDELENELQNPCINSQSTNRSAIHFVFNNDSAVPYINTVRIFPFFQCLRFFIALDST